MSKYNQGILGPFSGRVGSVVGAKWKDQFVMRARPYRKQEVAPTARQLSQRNRFALMAEVMRTLSGAVNLGFKFNAKVQKMSARNIAMQENMQNAMVQSGGAWSINNLEVVVARGNFGNVQSIQGAYSANSMQVSWTNNAGAAIGIMPSGHTVVLADTDTVFIVFWNATKNQALYNNFSSAIRDDASAALVKPADWVASDDVYAFAFCMGQEVYRYISGSATPQEEEIAKEMIEGGYGVSTSAVVKIPIV